MSNEDILSAIAGALAAPRTRITTERAHELQDAISDLITDPNARAALLEHAPDQYVRLRDALAHSLRLIRRDPMLVRERGGRTRVGSRPGVQTIMRHPDTALLLRLARQKAANARSPGEWAVFADDGTVVFRITRAEDGTVTEFGASLNGVHP